MNELGLPAERKSFLREIFRRSFEKQTRPPRDCHLLTTSLLTSQGTWSV